MNRNYDLRILNRLGDNIFKRETLTNSVPSATSKSVRPSNPP